MTTRIKKYKSIIKKKNNKHFKIVLLAKTKLNAINILISNVLIDSYINYKEFVSTNVLKEYKTKKIKNPKTSVEYTVKIWLI